MTRREIVLQAGSDAELRQLLERIQSARIKLDAAGVTNPTGPADLRKLTPAQPEVNLGLTIAQASALMPCLLELIMNAAGHGLTDKRKPTGEEIDRTLAAAKSAGSGTVQAAIEFDDETARGRISVFHPIVVGFSPDFDLVTAKRARAAQSEVNPDGLGAGGIFRIEAGALDDEMRRAGLVHSEIDILDEPVARDNPGLGKRRRVWLDFERRSK